ncbi:multidrug effflux MFS transporter [Paraglaciecola aquimarina]|uniref:Bcr/CflA family efflux transporter n=1 Tax=Paraglaciecola aquimarina TaxID=1235557 RepID=A0ABU3SYE2_9ALTE|nr:multidrug effflux MFS transporter [Paraglaciecola aquimarina]MDU0355028.1 multidrug effflux MFS transporter [Paraglaciecola aquimarina]
MQSKTLLPLLILMVIFSPLAIDIFLPALPVMAKEFSVSLTQMQASITVFILSMGFGQILSGPLADRYGRRPVAIGGILIYGVAAILAAMATNVELLLLSRLAQGLGACAIVVAAFACVRDKYNALQSGAMYSYLNSAICCIPALAPLLGSLLTEKFGWRSNFEFMAIYAAVAGAIIIFSLKESRPQDTVQHKKLVTVARYFPILKHPVFIFHALLVMLAMAIILAYVSSSPAWLMARLGLSQAEFVFWFSINAALNIVACVIAPKCLTKWGARATIGAGMLMLILAGLLMLALLGVNEPLGFMLPVMISSLGFSLLMGACSGQALAPFGDKAGTASALLGFIQMSGAAVIVGLLQMLPINEAEQLTVLMLCTLPVYILWKLPVVKKRITLDAY